MSPLEQFCVYIFEHWLGYIIIAISILLLGLAVLHLVERKLPTLPAAPAVVEDAPVEAKDNRSKEAPLKAFKNLVKRKEKKT